MSFFSSPQPFRLRQSLAYPTDPSIHLHQQQQTWPTMPWRGLATASTSQEASPDVPYLAMMILEAVVEVVCVSAPGYLVARQGLFTAEMQKFTANLNVALFTPCLIFTKLAAQLSAEKLAELAIIPVIFVMNTCVAFFCAWVVTKLFRFGRRQRNFVIAMGVFGNANSLPISLVMSLSHTVPGLHWRKVPGDNDAEVAARGILYLLIFQQLGQLVRWTWGYNVLLAPKEAYEETPEHVNNRLENGEAEDEQQQPLLVDYERDEDEETQQGTPSEDQDRSVSDLTQINDTDSVVPPRPSRFNSGGLRSGDQTPVTHDQVVSSGSSNMSGKMKKHRLPSASEILPPSANEHGLPTDPSSEADEESAPSGIRGFPARCRLAVRRAGRKTKASISRAGASFYRALPTPLQRVLNVIGRFFRGVWGFMNPPLWAMLVAIFVAAIPDVQRFFFTEGTFVNNTVTSAIEQQAGVAVPLILVVLGGNLARNTLPPDDYDDPSDEKKILIASLVARMVLPFMFMAPMLAVLAKFASISILDDPIFVIVCFLVIGSPTALQLAQICQINNVYMGAMSQLLFQGYVVWILPSTLVMVITALTVVQWAKGGE